MSNSLDPQEAQTKDAAESSFPPRYDFATSEEALYQIWEQGGFFKPSEDPSKEPFTVMMPPPNATGTLHLGHAARITTEDILTRFHRMRGKRALYLPGTDHAAIATQSKVESIIQKEEGKTRHDLGREAFLERVKTYVAGSQDTIRNQVRRTGASCDWSREAYTFSPELSHAVFVMFQKMYADGLIYRGARSVNWDPKLSTTVSDIEIEYEEEKADFYVFKYGPFEIGTARPETKFGDKYLVVHPEDTRYAQYKHGDTFTCEWINGPITATIIKDEAADPAFGTGAMTITPWHSLEDFDIAEKHHLDREQIIGLDGTLLPIAGAFAEMPIAKARPLIVEKLREKGLLIRVEEGYVHRVAKNSRGGGVIEPQILKQWFVNVNKPAIDHLRDAQKNEIDLDGKRLSLKEAMNLVVREKHIQILPERFNTSYFGWVDNLRDWCISRQIWWGHRIPVWYPAGAVGDETQVVVSETDPSTAEKPYVQDEDTLDTWFSAALWTFSTLGWPNKTKDLETFHPTSVLETAYDILFFWVARMILASTYALGEVPFKTVYLSGLIRDKQGHKMSKSLGNGIDPLEMIDAYGADALRLALIVGTTPGNDVRVYEEKVKGYRNFATKVWNVARFITTKFPDVSRKPDEVPEAKTLADRWILARLAHTQYEVTVWIDGDEEKNIESKYDLGIAAEQIYKFVWNEFADWYIEILKQENQKGSGAVARYVLETVLSLLHPYTPFITEEIWQHLDRPALLIVSAWPGLNGEELATRKNDEAESAFTIVKALVETVRSFRGAFRLPRNVALDAVCNGLSDEQRSLMEHLAGIHLVPELATGAAVQLHAVGTELTLHIEGVVDLAAERVHLEKEITQQGAYAEKIRAKLSNDAFGKHAPQALVEEEQEKLKEAEHTLQQLEEQRAQLG